MTTKFGSLVGAVKQLALMRPVDAAFENSKDVVLVRDTYELSTLTATSVIQAAVLGWETVLNPSSKFWFDDLGTGGTVSLGDVTYPNALASSVNTDSAAGSSDALAAVDIANYFQPLWQMLGYASLAAAKLIGNQCELLFTRNTASGSGTLTWQLIGSRRV